MKKKVLALMLSVMAVIIFFSGVSFAGSTADPGIQNRIVEMQKRIDAGVADGSLSRAEAANVQATLNRIRDEEARLKADGKLTPTERARLHRELDREGNKVFRKKHNPRRRR